MPVAPSGPPINPFPKEPLVNAVKPKEGEEVDPTLPVDEEDEDEDLTSA